MTLGVSGVVSWWQFETYGTATEMVLSVVFPAQFSTASSTSMWTPEVYDGIEHFAMLVTSPTFYSGKSNQSNSYNNCKGHCGKRPHHRCPYWRYVWHIRRVNASVPCVL